MAGKSSRMGRRCVFEFALGLSWHWICCVNWPTDVLFVALSQRYDILQVMLGKAKGGSFKKREAYRKWLCNTHLNILSFDFSIEIPAFSSLCF